MYISFLLSVTFNLSERTLHVRFRASMSAKKKNTVVHYSEKLKTLFYGLVPMNFPKFLNLIYIPGHMLAWLAFAYYNTRGTLWLNRFYSTIFKELHCKYVSIIILSIMPRVKLSSYNLRKETCFKPKIMPLKNSLFLIVWYLNMN